MVNHGAKNITFISRSGAAKEEARRLIEQLKSKGARILAFACNLCDSNTFKLVVEECRRAFPPIRGVLQGAMVLQDSTIANMTCKDFTTALRPKVQGCWNLHQYLPEALDFFVMLSSGAGIAGSRGQGNYAAANTYQDALAQHR